MKQQKRYEDDLRRELVSRKLYDDKLERLITVAARCRKFIDMMEDELSRSGLTIRQTGSQGQTKVTQHPHVESIRKFNATLAYCLVHLGLAAATANDDAAEPTPLEQWLRELA